MESHSWRGVLREGKGLEGSRQEVHRASPTPTITPTFLASDPDSNRLYTEQTETQNMKVNGGGVGALGKERELSGRWEGRWEAEQGTRIHTHTHIHHGKAAVRPNTSQY